MVATAVAVLWWGVRRARGTGSEPFPPLAVLPHPALLAAAALVVLGFGIGRWLPPLAWAAP